MCCLGMWIPGWPLFSLRQNHFLKRIHRDTPWKAALIYFPNWSDFLRTGILSGMLMMWEQAYTSTHPEGSLTATGAIFAAMTIGTIIQCLFVKHRRLFILPTFYVMGLSLFVAGWEIGLLAVACTLALGSSLPNRTGLLPTLGLILILGGWVTGSPIPKLITGGMITFIPFMWVMATNKKGLQPAKDLDT